MCVDLKTWTRTALALGVLVVLRWSIEYKVSGFRRAHLGMPVPSITELHLPEVVSVKVGYTGENDGSPGENEREYSEQDRTDAHDHFKKTLMLWWGIKLIDRNRTLGLLVLYGDLLLFGLSLFLFVGNLFPWNLGRL